MATTTAAAQVLGDGRRPPAGPPPAAGSACRPSLRWAVAFHGAFAFLPLGTVLSVWLEL